MDHGRRNRTPSQHDRSRSHHRSIRGWRSFPKRAMVLGHWKKERRNGFKQTSDRIYANPTIHIEDRRDNRAARGFRRMRENGNPKTGFFTHLHQWGPSVTENDLIETKGHWLATNHRIEHLSVAHHPTAIMHFDCGGSRESPERLADSGTPNHLWSSSRQMVDWTTSGTAGVRAVR